jgi:hypothetical protein
MFKANSISHIHGTLLKRTDNGAGPEGLNKKNFKNWTQCKLAAVNNNGDKQFR